MSTQEIRHWFATGCSVRGASHNKLGLPNQDAIAWRPNKGALSELFIPPPILMALSDGHGSEKSFRSQVGSQIAVDIALNTLQQLLNMTPPPHNLSHIKSIAEERIPKMITSMWRDAVQQDMATNNDAYQHGLRALAQHKPDAAKSVSENEFLAYGATLLGILVTDSYVLFLQLGDGDLLFIDSQERIQRAFERDERLIANETLSLCLPNAWRDFQVRFLPTIDSGPPLLVMAATDGYSNSYDTENDFDQVAFFYLDEIRRTSFSTLPQRIERFVADISQRGSGDDISIGLIKRVERDDQQVRSQDMRAQRTMLIEQKRSQEAETAARVQLQETVQTNLAATEARHDQIETTLRDELQTGLTNEATQRTQLHELVKTGFADRDAAFAALGATLRNEFQELVASETATRTQLGTDLHQAVEQVNSELQATRRELCNLATGAEQFDQQLQMLKSKIETDQLASVREQLRRQQLLIILAMIIAGIALVSTLVATFVL
jgi:hypothetical protein